MAAITRDSEVTQQDLYSGANIPELRMSCSSNSNLIQMWVDLINQEKGHLELDDETISRFTEENFIHALFEMKNQIHSLSLPKNPSDDLLHNIFASAYIFHDKKIKCLSIFSSLPRWGVEDTRVERISLRNAGDMDTQRLSQRIERSLRENDGLILYDLDLNQEKIEFLKTFFLNHHADFNTLIQLDDKSRFFDQEFYQMINDAHCK